MYHDFTVTDGSREGVYHMLYPDTAVWAYVKEHMPPKGTVVTVTGDGKSSRHKVFYRRNSWDTSIVLRRVDEG